jgi:hypothetical protein
VRGWRAGSRCVPLCCGLLNRFTHNDHTERPHPRQTEAVESGRVVRTRGLFGLYDVMRIGREPPL